MIKKELVEAALLELNIAPYLKGFKYIVNAILLMDQDNSYICEIGKLRDTIALQEGVPATTVEKNIRTAIQDRINCDESIKTKYFGSIRKGQAALLSNLYMRLRG